MLAYTGGDSPRLRTSALLWVRRRRFGVFVHHRLWPTGKRDHDRHDDKNGRHHRENHKPFSLGQVARPRRAAGFTGCGSSAGDCGGRKPLFCIAAVRTVSAAGHRRKAVSVGRTAYLRFGGAADRFSTAGHRRKAIWRSGRLIFLGGGADRFNGWASAEGDFVGADGFSSWRGDGAGFWGCGSRAGGFGGAEGIASFGGNDALVSGPAAATGCFRAAGEAASSPSSIASSLRFNSWLSETLSHSLTSAPLGGHTDFEGTSSSGPRGSACCRCACLRLRFDDEDPQSMIGRGGSPCLGCACFQASAAGVGRRPGTVPGSLSFASFDACKTGDDFGHRGWAVLWLLRHHPLADGLESSRDVAPDRAQRWCRVLLVTTIA